VTTAGKLTAHLPRPGEQLWRENDEVRIAAALLALIAVACITAAIVGMVTGRPGARTGGLLRGLALLFFAGAVALNVAAH
jgi:hypothetical protein